MTPLVRSIHSGLHQMKSLNLRILGYGSRSAEIRFRIEREKDFFHVAEPLSNVSDVFEPSIRRHYIK